MIEVFHHGFVHDRAADNFGPMRWKALRWFVLTTVLLLLPGVWAIATHEHLELHRSINRWHASFFDRSFAALTHLADGITVALVALLFLLRSWRAFIVVGASAILSALITQTLKRTWFADVDRPIEFLDRMPGLHLVEGVVMNHHNSFPSGHSTAAFSACCAIAIVLARPGWSVLLALLAGALAFSRVYLSQHFTEDIVVGAIIGTATAAVVGRWAYTGARAARSTWDQGPFQRGRSVTPLS